jgi:hypothetical protein
MIFRKSLGLLSLIFFVACASSGSKPLEKETQIKVEKAQFRTKPELVKELVVVIESSDLKSDEKAELMGKFEKFVQKMAVNLIEQNKIVSALINNLSSSDHKGMKIKADLLRKYEGIERDSTNSRVAMVKEIGSKLQGNISADKIEKINALLNLRRFLILEEAKK